MTNSALDNREIADKLRQYADAINHFNATGGIAEVDEIADDMRDLAVTLELSAGALR